MSAVRTAGAIVAGLVLTIGAAACGDATRRTTSVEPRPASESGQDLKRMAEQVQGYVATVWPRTERIWPGMDFSDHVLVLTDGKTAWRIDVDERRKVPMSKLAANNVEAPAPGGFATTVWDGHEGVVIRAPGPEEIEQLGKDPTGLTSADPALEVLELATHEQFHTFVQQDKKDPWVSLAKFEKKTGGGGDRNETYPIVAKPRMLRAMVYNSLLAAYKNPDQRDEHLAAAAYWQQQWAQQYPDEATTDEPIALLEGTAKYVEKAAVSMAAVDEPENADQRHDYLSTTLQPMKVAAKGVEPYAIGATALLVADQENLDVKETLTKRPVTPQSQVLKGVKPVEQQMPPSVRNGIERQVAKTNSELAPLIEPFVADATDNKHMLLLMPQDKALNQNISGKGFYTTKKLPTTIVPAATVSFKTDGGRIDLAKVTVAMVPYGNDAYWTLPIDPNGKGISLNGGRLQIDTHGIKANTAVKKAQQDGQQLLIMK